MKLPLWHGTQILREPFANWFTHDTLPWYTAYNVSKHDRLEKFPEANFNHLIDAVCGLVVLLAAQFWTHDYTANSWGVSISGPDATMQGAIGGYFRIKFPDDWSEEEKYGFKWDEIKNEPDPFQQYPYR